jgi:sec-independent protein translocase protein TatA
MFGTLGGPEVVLILVVALIVFGPRKLPEIGKTAGKMLAEFRKASHEFKRTIEDEVEAEKLRDKPAAVAASLPETTPPAEAAPVVMPAAGSVQRGAEEPEPISSEPIEPS